MKLLFDNNLSLRIADILQADFPGSMHVFQLKMEHLSDPEIWQFAKNNNFLIVTKDKDFYYLATTFGYPPKIIWLMTGNCSNEKVINFLLENKNEIEEFIFDVRSILILK